MEHMKSKKLKFGKTIDFQKGKVCVIKWKDKKDISLISFTIHSPSMMNIETRKGTIKKL